jgi:hypothetical protein
MTTIPYSQVLVECNSSDGLGYCTDLDFSNVEKVKEVCEGMKKTGNNYFQSQNFAAALRSYTKVCNVIGVLTFQCLRYLQHAERKVKKSEKDSINTLKELEVLPLLCRALPN